MSDAAALRAAALKAFVGGRFAEAIAGFEAALAAAPDDRESLRGLAMASAQAGRLDDAVRWARRLTEAAPHETLSWSTLSMMLQKTGDIKGAEEAQARARVSGWKDQLKGKTPPPG